MEILLESVPIVKEETNWLGDSIASSRHTEYAIRLARIFKIFGRIPIHVTHHYLCFEVGGQNVYQDIKDAIKNEEMIRVLEIDPLFSDVFCSKFSDKVQSDDIIKMMNDFPDQFIQ